MDDRFPLGKDVEIYIEKALEKMKITYPWASRDMFPDYISYAIEEDNGKTEFVRYYKWTNGESVRDVIDLTDMDIVDYIARNQAIYVEDANPVREVFKVPFDRGTDAHGWMLERYEFRTHVLGGYSAFVEAGNRSTGGSRSFFIPPAYMEGTFSDFLDRYCDMVPGGAFGLYRQDLEETEGLKEFLGFKE